MPDLDLDKIRHRPSPVEISVKPCPSDPDTSWLFAGEMIVLTREERDQLVERIRELEAALEPGFVDAAIRDGTLEATIDEHPGIRIMVASFRESLTDAENYVEARLVDNEEDDVYVVRVQKGTGKTPHEKREDAEAERDAYRAAVFEEVEAPTGETYERCRLCGASSAFGALEHKTEDHYKYLRPCPLVETSDQETPDDD